jgi:hypothetical protein
MEENPIAPCREIMLVGAIH